MRSKVVLMQVKEAIISLKKQNKSEMVLIFWWKLTSSNAAFTPLDALPGLYCCSFSCSLWVFLPPFLYLITKTMSGDCLSHWRISHFFTSRNSWAAFALRFESLSIFKLKGSRISFELLAETELSGDQCLAHFRTNSATSISNRNINKH